MKLLLLILGYIFIFAEFASTVSGQMSMNPLIKPKRLVAGNTVGLISPASPYEYLFPNASVYQTKIVGDMKGMNLNVVFGEYMSEIDGYLAGPDKFRASDVNTMFENSSVQYVLANRGGWGCDRILNLLDYSKIQSNPKIIMGYSDLTALLIAIHFKTGLVTFYGPMGLDDWSAQNYNRIYAEKVLFNNIKHKFSNPSDFSVPIKTFHGGKARGKLLGGNLSVFNTLLSSEYMTVQDWSTVILFLEEVDEKPYTVDRYLTTLRLSGVLDKVAGFVWGTCSNCVAPNPSQSFAIEQVLHYHLSPLKVPTFSGFMVGHDLSKGQFTLPIGIQVEMDADQGTLTMLETALS